MVFAPTKGRARGVRDDPYRLLPLAGLRLEPHWTDDCHWQPCTDGWGRTILWNGRPRAPRTAAAWRCAQHVAADDAVSRPCTYRSRYSRARRRFKRVCVGTTSCVKCNSAFVQDAWGSYLACTCLWCWDAAPGAADEDDEDEDDNATPGKSDAQWSAPKAPLKPREYKRAHHVRHGVVRGWRRPGSNAQQTLLVDDEPVVHAPGPRDAAERRGCTAAPRGDAGTDLAGARGSEPERAAFQVYVKDATEGGDVCITALDIKGTHSIGDVMVALAEKTGKPRVLQCSLTYKGRYLDNDETVDGCQLRLGATLLLGKRLRGRGAPEETPVTNDLTRRWQWCTAQWASSCGKGRAGERHRGNAEQGWDKRK